MCGIFGIVVQQEQVLGRTLLEALRRLAYRGYDSVGCAVIDQAGRVDLRKDAGKIDDVNDRLHFADMVGVRGIAQLRWATFGAPSQLNAQPHIDSDGDLVGAHNGNIVNHMSLRERFIESGLTVRGTNDGESCVHAVEQYVDQGHSVQASIRKASRDLEGDYAFIVGRAGSTSSEDALHVIKQGSGLVIGVGDGFCCVSSDLPSILPLTDRIVRVRDGEMVTLYHDRFEIRRVEDGAAVDRKPERFTEGMDAAEKGGYEHFMLKEIHEQPKAAEEMLHWLSASPHVDPFLSNLVAARHVYLVGCGTSYHACVLGAALFNRLAGMAAVPVLAPVFRETLAHTLSSDDAVVLVSQSGETKDVLNALNAARPSEAAILGVLNVLGSTLMHASDQYLPLACGYEISVPATKTLLNQALLFYYLADRVRTTGPGERWIDVPSKIEQTIRQTDAFAKEVAALLMPFHEMYYLGYGLTLGMAMEGALKLKEVSYAHCEGMLSAEFKHGPLSAVYDGYPVVFVTAPDDARMMINHVNEVTCRGGRAIIVGRDDELLRKNAHDYLPLPEASHELSAILAAVPLQLISYYLSVAKGHNPDFPRNLSKTLTVD